MRICIFGAGAVGSHFAVRLALAGHDVSCVMRGPHLEAVRANGLTLRVGDAEFSARVNASDNPATLGPQDFVISTLKATGLSSLATGLPPLLRDDTAIVFAQNGIPWWYDIGLASDHPPAPDLGFLDPGGRLRAAIPKERIIGGVIFSANEMVAPGIVVNKSTDRNMLLFGECDDRASERIERLRAALVRPRYSRRRNRDSGSDLDQADRQHVDLGAVLAHRANGKGGRSGPRLARYCAAPARRGSSDRPQLLSRHQAQHPGGAPADHKPSLLQDYERGRAMEIDALARAPAAFARIAGLSTPMLDLLTAMAIRQARDKGLYSGAV